MPKKPMRVGIFADTHDHLDNIRRAVDIFNRRRCEVVLFAGDFTSTFSLPPLRHLACPLIACFGDNDANKVGLRGGLRIIGTVHEPPHLAVLEDGTRVVLAHMWRQLRGFRQPFDVAVYAHTHKPSIERDERGRLLINPGETSGWTFRRPTVAILDTDTMEATIVPLPSMPVPDDVAHLTTRRP